MATTDHREPTSNVSSDPKTRFGAELHRLDFRRLFESAPGLYLVLDRQLRIVALSDAYARATMIRREEVFGKDIFEVVTDIPGDPAATSTRNLRASLERVLVNRTSDSMSVHKYNVRRPENEGGASQERYWSALNSPVLAPDGSVEWIVHSVDDVTELITAKRAGEEQLLINETLRESWQVALKSTQDALETRRQAEQLTAELREKQAELHEAQRLAHIGSWYWDVAADIITGSDELLRIFGLDPATERLPTFADQKGRFYPEAAWRRLNAALRESIRTGVVYELDLPGFRRGIPIWVTTRVEPVRDGAGRFVGLRGTVHDITRHRQAIEALHESERREYERAAELAALLEAVPTPVLIAHDSDCLHITGNRAADELLRNQPGAEVSLSAAVETRPHHYKAMKDGRVLANDELPAQRAARGIPVRDYEFSLVFDDGATRHVLGYGTPLRDERGQPRGAVHVLVDITERKRAQEALQAREAQLHSFVEQAPVPMAMFDRNMNYVAASERWRAEYGKGHSDLVGLNHYLVHPDLPERWRENHRRALAGESLSNDDDLWRRADGTEVSVRWVVRPWLDAHGGIGGVIIMAENISARKRVEEALRASEERLRAVIQASEMGTFEIDSGTGETHWNSVEFELLGLKPGEVQPSPETFLRFVHPEDRAQVRSEWGKALQTGFLDAEFRIVRADGSERWLAGKGRFVTVAPGTGSSGEGADAGGGSPRFLGVNFDITERRRVEHALAEHRQRLAGIVGSAMDAIISINGAREIVLFNTAAEKMFQCGAGEAIGGPIDRFIPGRFRDAHAGHIRRFGETGLTNRAMGPLRAISGLRANGEEFPIEASISQVEVAGERLFTVILRDISERKRLEQEILEISAREQRRIGRDLHDDLCQWLAGTELLCSVLAKNLQADSPAHAASVLKIAESIRQALARARMLAHGLEPSVIESEGLVGALLELAANAEQMFHIRCRYEGPPNVQVRDELTALHLYRIAQEAISNAVRHGGAQKVGILLQVDPDQITMLIRDDGCGMPQPPPQTTGMGLRNMRYRSGIIGGTLDIRTAVGGGTEIACTFPKTS